MTRGRRWRPASDRTLHRTAWTLAAASTVVTTVGIILAVAEGLSGGVGLLAPMSIVGIGYAVIGARVVDVRPRNPVGWLLIGTALSWGLSSTCYQYAELALSQLPGPAAGATLAAWVYSWAWLPGGAVLLVFMPLLFPTGDVLSRRWYRFAVFMAILVTFDTVVHAIASLPYLNDLPRLIAYSAQLDPGVMGALAGLGDFWYFGSLVWPSRPSSSDSVDSERDRATADPLVWDRDRDRRRRRDRDGRPHARHRRSVDDRGQRHPASRSGSPCCTIGCTSSTGS